MMTEGVRTLLGKIANSSNVVPSHDLARRR